MLEKMRVKGARKGLKVPGLEEVIHAREAPFNPTVFGVSLEDIMELQKDKYPNMKIPWIQKSLFDYVIRLSGHLTEGIFRYIRGIIFVPIKRISIILAPLESQGT